MEPRVSYFIYSEGLQNIQAESTVQKQQPGITPINIRHIFILPFLPSQLSFGVMFGILAKWDQYNTLQFDFIAPDDEVAFSTGEAGLPHEERQSVLPDFAQGFMVAFDVRNIPIKIEGEYKSRIMVDGKEIGLFPIWIGGARDEKKGRVLSMKDLSLVYPYCMVDVKEIEDFVLIDEIPITQNIYAYDEPTKIPICKIAIEEIEEFVLL